MTLIIELSEAQEVVLRAKAEQQGLSSDQFARQILENELSTESPPRPPIWERIVERMKNLPEDVFERLPEDGASEHDHYLYGTPKRSQ